MCFLATRVVVLYLMVSFCVASGSGYVVSSSRGLLVAAAISQHFC